MRKAESAADALFGEKTACVYLFKCEDYYKVGVAQDIKRRKSQLQTPWPLKVVYALRMQRGVAYQVEHLVHVKLGKGGTWNSNGEWYYGYKSGREIAEYIKKIAEGLGASVLVEQDIGESPPVATRY